MPRNNGCDDEAAVVRDYWPTLRDNVLVSRVPLHETLRQMARPARRLGRLAPGIEERQADETTCD